MNQKLEKEEPKPPSGIIARLKKYFRNPFFIKTQTVAEVADFLRMLLIKILLIKRLNRLLIRLLGLDQQQ